MEKPKNSKARERMNSTEGAMLADLPCRCLMLYIPEPGVQAANQAKHWRSTSARRSPSMRACGMKKVGIGSWYQSSKVVRSCFQFQSDGAPRPEILPDWPQQQNTRVSFTWTTTTNTSSAATKLLLSPAFSRHSSCHCLRRAARAP